MLYTLQQRTSHNSAAYTTDGGTYNGLGVKHVIVGLEVSGQIAASTTYVTIKETGKSLNSTRVNRIDIHKLRKITDFLSGQASPGSNPYSIAIPIGNTKGQVQVIVEGSSVASAYTAVDLSLNGSGSPLRILEYTQTSFDVPKCHALFVFLANLNVSVLPIQMQAGGQSFNFQGATAWRAYASFGQVETPEADFGLLWLSKAFGGQPRDISINAPGFSSHAFYALCEDSPDLGSIIQNIQNERMMN